MSKNDSITGRFDFEDVPYLPHGNYKPDTPRQYRAHGGVVITNIPDKAIVRQMDPVAAASNAINEWVFYGGFLICESCPGYWPVRIALCLRFLEGVPDALLERTTFNHLLPMPPSQSDEARNEALARIMELEDEIRRVKREAQREMRSARETFAAAQATYNAARQVTCAKRVAIAAALLGIRPEDLPEHEKITEEPAAVRALIAGAEKYLERLEKEEFPF